MVDLLTRECAAASRPGLPRNTNRYPCVIGATPPRSERIGRQEKSAEGNRHRIETIGFGDSKRAHWQSVGPVPTNELRAREASAANAEREFSQNSRARAYILLCLVFNLSKRLANCEPMRNRVFDDEYRSDDLAASG
jgi:hypothetical protein